MSKQDLTGYILIVLFLMGPVSSLLGLLPNLTQAQVALNRLEELGLSLLSDKPEPEVPTAEVEEPEWHSLELRGATHSYHHEKDNSTFTLGPIDATFSPGELVFLIGGNGKPTLAKLLTGLYIPEAGEIRLDGRAVTDENRDNYRQLFTAIFSDFYLFHRLPGSTTSYLDEQARDYLVQFQLDQKVQVKNGMLDTPGLSSGQRKRLALLLAYMENRSFYLFDSLLVTQDRDACNS